MNMLFADGVDKNLLPKNVLILNGRIKCETLDDFKSKYPLSEIYYENTLELNVYNRFTLSGVK